MNGSFLWFISLSLTNDFKSVDNSRLLFFFRLLFWLFFLFGSFLGRFFFLIFFVVIDLWNCDDSAQLKSDLWANAIYKFDSFGDRLLFIVNLFQRFPFEWIDFWDPTLQNIVCQFADVFYFSNFRNCLMNDWKCWNNQRCTYEGGDFSN